MYKKIIALFFLLTLNVASVATAETQTNCGKSAVAGELIAELRQEDGSVKQYFRTLESIRSMNSDFIALMKSQNIPAAVYMKAPFATPKGALALCGGTTDCSTKKCTSGSCYYGNIGMSGCRCS